MRWGHQAPKADSCWKQRVNSLGQLVGRTLSQVSTTYNLCSKILHQRSKSDAGSLCSVASASGPGASLRITGKSGLLPGKTQKPFLFCTQLQEIPGPSDLSPPVPSLRLETRRATSQPWAARLRASHIPAGHRGRQPSHRKLVGTVPGLALEKATLPGVLGGGGRSHTIHLPCCNGDTAFLPQAGLPKNQPCYFRLRLYMSNKCREPGPGQLN